MSIQSNRPFKPEHLRDIREKVKFYDEWDGYTEHRESSPNKISNVNRVGAVERNKELQDS